MNKTEQRQTMLAMGLGRMVRHASDDDLAEWSESRTAQIILREKTEAHVQRNWTILKEVLTCQGNCASPINQCPDAQASICYHANRNMIDG